MKEFEKYRNPETLVYEFRFDDLLCASDTFDSNNENWASDDFVWKNEI